MDFWRDPKQSLSMLFTAMGAVTALLVILGPFNAYAGGWGKWLLLGVTLLFVGAASLVKKLPI